MKLICVTLVVLTATAAAAHADSKALARDAYREGTRLYDVGDYQKALVSFKTAYLNYEDSAFLFNMAQCLRQLGERREAVRVYKSYLRKVPDAPNRPEVVRLIVSLEASIEEERKAQISPPQGTLSPTRTEPATTPAVAAAPTARPTAAVVAAAPPPPSPRTPVYRKWWLWTTVGLAAAGVAVGLGVGLTRNNFDSTLPGFNRSSSVTVRF